MKYKVYLFDFDGTLFNTEKALNYIFKGAFAVAGVNITDDEVMEISRQPFEKVFFEKGCDPTKGKEFEMKLIELVHSQKSVDLTEAFPETKEVLESLKKQGAILGVVTSNNSIHVRNIFEHCGIDKNLLDVVVGNKEAKHSKPHPEPILKALEMLNYQGDGSDVVYIGDALNDALAAINAKVNPILLDRNDEHQTNEYKKIKTLLEIE